MASSSRPPAPTSIWKKFWAKIRLHRPDRQQELGEVVEIVNACISAFWGILGGIVLFRDFNFHREYVLAALFFTTIALLYFIYNTERKKGTTKFFKKWSELPYAISNYGSFTAFLLSLGALIGTFIPEKQSFEETQAIIMAKIKSESSLVASNQEEEVRNFYDDDACVITRSRTEFKTLKFIKNGEEERMLDLYLKTRKKDGIIVSWTKNTTSNKVYYKINFAEEKIQGIERIISQYYFLAGGSTNRYDHRNILVEKPDGNTVVARSDTWFSTLNVKYDGKMKKASWGRPLPNYSEVWKFRYSSEKGWQAVCFIGGIENGITGNANKRRRMKPLNDEVEKLKKAGDCGP